MRFFSIVEMEEYPRPLPSLLSRPLPLSTQQHQVRYQHVGVLKYDATEVELILLLKVALL